MKAMKRTIYTTMAVLVLFATLLSIVVTSSEGNVKDKLHLVSSDFESIHPEIGLVVITHGWIEKGPGNWPEEMALEIQKRIDPNNWLCGYFDWEKGARTINATSAAEYARDTAGPALAQQILELDKDFQHIHLIGHSSGCWLVSEAAKILAEKTKSDIHLTLLDAYVPVFWDEDSMADINSPPDVNCWPEHYYTRDYTLGWTQYDLKNAHNVDITAVDKFIKDHNFPWRWYYASIANKYPPHNFSDHKEIITFSGDIQYGFARSLEAGGRDTWDKSLNLPKGNKAVKLKKP
ncbi:MAG: alpha/beta hydrolase family protein [Planctomycetota bacterium]